MNPTSFFGHKFSILVAPGKWHYWSLIFLAFCFCVAGVAGVVGVVGVVAAAAAVLAFVAVAAALPGLRIQKDPI